MINNVTLVGRITKDLELRYTQTGIAVCNFTLAVNNPFTSQSGERDASFINCVVWKKQAENLANYMGKGSLIGVVGRIQTRTWDGDDGKRNYVTEVVAESVQFLESKKSKEQSNGGGYNAPSQYNQQGNAPGVNEDPFANGGPVTVHDDDLPF